MGLFKKKAKAENQTVEAVETKAPKKGARNKKNELVKVLPESVWESVNEEFKQNEQFIITDADGNTQYVAFMFDTMQCGGLAGKEARKDESKGSIIEAIRTGSIKTYVRLEMLMDNVFIIIPDLETIDAMDEFGILADGQYILCTISSDGNDIKTITDANDEEIIVSFDKIKEVIQNSLDIKVLFPGGGDMTDAMLGFDSSSQTEEDIPVDDFDEELSDLPDDIDDIPDDLEDLPDDLEDDIEPQPVATESPTQAPAVAPTQASVVENSDDGSLPDDYVDADDLPSESDDEGGYDELEDITKEYVEEYVARTFYSDDLGLEVSTKPFDMQFMHGNAYVPFNEDRGAGLLNEYIANLSKDANTRLQRMHNENLFRMREKYMRLIQQHCIRIAEALDVSNESTQYGKFRKAIELNRDENNANVNSAVEKKRNQLNEAWNRKLEQVANEAAASAKAQYEDRYGRSHESDLQNLVSLEKDEIERDYNAALRRLNDDRRAEASKLLDIAVNETLSEMADLYIKVLHDEQREQARLQREITKFIDDNRKDEKARIETIAEEQRRVKQSEELRKEYASKIKAMTSEFDMQKTVLQADVDRMRQEHEIEIEKLENTHENQLKEEKARSEELQKKLDELLDKYADIDAAKALEYKDKLEDLEHEKETWKRHTDDIIAEHKKSEASTFKMSIIVIIAAVIAAIGIGFMCGSILNIRKTSQIEQQSISQSYQTESDQTIIVDDNATDAGADVVD